MKMIPVALILGVSLTAVNTSTVPRKKADAKSLAVQKQALQEFNSLIGGWRGVGMRRRNSTRGAWIETAEWVWDFKHGVAVRYEVQKGRLLQSARVTYDPDRKEYVIAAEFAGKVKRTYRGKLQGNKLTAVSRPDKHGNTFRMSVRKLNEKRTIVLHESRRSARGQFFRIAEIGYTRKGTSLAVAGVDGPECVVTGGKGTIRVSYKGQTYYVCCSGCKQAFEDDPEGILAEYRRRLAKRKKGK